MAEISFPSVKNTAAEIRNRQAALMTERDALRADCADLTKALAQPGVDKDVIMMMNNRFIAITNGIGDITKEITGLDARLPKVDVPKDGWSYEALGLTFTVATTSGSAWWVLYPRYCVWRHLRYPYTPRQIEFRRLCFVPNFPDPVKPSAQRLPRQVFQGFLALCVVQNIVIWWRKSAQGKVDTRTIKRKIFAEL